MYKHCTYKASTLYNYFIYLCMKTERIGLRIEEETLVQMKARAKKLGLSLTAYINYCIARELDDTAKASA